MYCKTQEWPHWKLIYFNMCSLFISIKLDSHHGDEFHHPPLSPVINLVETIYSLSPNLHQLVMIRVLNIKIF